MIGSQEKAAEAQEDSVIASVVAAFAVWGAIFVYLVAGKASTRKHRGRGLAR